MTPSSAAAARCCMLRLQSTAAVVCVCHSTPSHATAAPSRCTLLHPAAAVRHRRTPPHAAARCCCCALPPLPPPPPQSASCSPPSKKASFTRTVETGAGVTCQNVVGQFWMHDAAVDNDNGTRCGRRAPFHKIYICQSTKMSLFSNIYPSPQKYIYRSWLAIPKGCSADDVHHTQFNASLSPSRSDEVQA